MAANKNVIVLIPSGHRQNVKVTPNTTILQILEEICKKHGYNLDDYDLKHFKKVLDPNAILRFTGLPNNAQLEMIPCTKTRTKSTVVIGIQLENGQRLMGEFVPSTTLIEILQYVHLDQDLDRTVLTYMHREVYGTEALKNITLKSLGLNNGKAVLRLMYRDPQQINEQMQVPQAFKSSEQLSTNYQNNEDKSSLSSSTHKQLDSVTKEAIQTSELKVSSQDIKTKENTEQVDEENKIISTEEYQPVPSTSKNHCPTKSQILTKKCAKNKIKDIDDMKYLGERNALVFNQAIVQALPKDEFLDDFYDLTVDDAKVLLRDAKRRREELEEAPFLTKAQRQLNQEKRTLCQLNKYRHAIIRIQFPDQFVLQGLFKPLETVQTIKDFVKTYLIDPDSDFIIFTTPPKHILNPDACLLDENLVPSTIVYYSGPSSLKPDVKQKSIDPIKVEMQATKIRMSMISQENNIVDKDIKDIDTTNNKSDKSLNKNKNKIPKWLNTSIK